MAYDIHNGKFKITTKDGQKIENRTKYYRKIADRVDFLKSK